MIPLNKLILYFSPETAEDIARLSSLSTEYLVVKPSELIRTGISVSRARPELVSASSEAIKNSGYRGRILCGAGCESEDNKGQG